MKPKLQIAIMAHPERWGYIPYLKNKLGDVPVVWDNKNDLWDTCRRTWIVARTLAKQNGAEYCLVIQDDALPCDNFVPRAEKLLEGDYIYSFFAGRLLASSINNALAKGQNEVFSGMIFNEVALCMRTEHVDRMIKFCDDRGARTDQEITKWARLARIKICYPLPSLVDHRDGESIYARNYNRPVWQKPRKAFYPAK